MFLGGLGCMLTAIALTNITLARGSYRAVLLQALALTAAADACFVIACWRATTAWRVAALVASLPTVGVVYDCVRRL